MSLNEVRRQRRSSSRSKSRGRSSAGARRRPRQATGRPSVDALDADAAGRLAAQRLEARRRRGVARRVARRRRHGAVAVAREQQPAERRVAAVPRRRPPHDRLVLRAGRARRRRAAGPRRAARPACWRLWRVEVGPLERRRRSSAGRPPSGSWNATGTLASGSSVGLPQVRAVDDRELEPLAAVDREDLDRLGVGLQPAAALLVAGVLRRPRRSAAAATPVSAVVAELLGRRRRVQQLADVAQVGQPRARRRRARRTRSGRPSASVIVSISDATPAPAQHARPAVQPRVDVLPLLLAGRGDALGAPAEERGQRGGAGARRRGRAARAPRAAAASRAPRSVPNTLPAPLMTAGTPTASSASRTSAGVAVGPHEHGDVAGRGRGPVGPRSRRRDDQQRRRGRRRGPSRRARAPSRAGVARRA